MTYYRLCGAGPVRTNGPDWDTTCNRVKGWRVQLWSGPGWRQLLVIDRETRRHYIRNEHPSGSTLCEIDRGEARFVYKSRELPTRLYPVLN